jgi:uncharacterized protein YggT (Ycf19 family)
MCLRVHGSFDIDTWDYPWGKFVPNVSDELVTVFSRIGASCDGFTISWMLAHVLCSFDLFNKLWLALTLFHSEGKIRCKWRQYLDGWRNG